jgi:preprotein translocase subunit SecE
MGVRIPPPVQINIKMTKVINYMTEAFEELKSNVTWITWAEAQKYTIIVALFSIIFSLMIWGFDSLFSKAISGFYNLIKG